MRSGRFDPELLEWNYRLTGLQEDRVREAAERVASWRLPPVEAEFLQRPSIDTLVAITLLAEGVERLVEHGAERTQLMAKLRRDPYPWPAWAEIRAGSILIAVSDGDVEIALEPDKASGKQPDFRIVSSHSHDGMNVEFKAVGLSEREADFCRRMCERLPSMVPARGLVTGHAPLRAPTIRLSASQLRYQQAEAARWAAEMAEFPAGLAGAIAVAQGTEPQYISRLRSRIERAIGQLPLEGESWVAIHWTNGATIDGLLEAIDWDAFPANLAGLLLVGDALVFPRQDIDVFVVVLGRGVGPEDAMQVDSTLDNEVARLVLTRVDESAGVRATVLRGQVGPGRSRELLRRDGSPRILPFNLVMSADPPELGGRGSATRVAE